MIENYPNTLKKIKITSKEIEEQIVDYTLSFPQIRDMRIEAATNAPLFLYSFYGTLLDSNKILTQEELWEDYKERAKNWISKSGMDESRLKALRARLFRAYPSFVRDIHFAKILEESKVFDLVYYNENVDTHYGSDIIIRYKSKLYCISLYIKTDRADNWREVKSKRHKLQDGYTYVELPINLDKSKKCGEFFLYSKDDVLRLKKILIEKDRG